MPQRGAGALLVVDDPLFSSADSKLVALAMRNRIPTMYYQSEFVQVGGLISYASNYAERFRQMGIYTAQILKGAKPAELPVEQPSRFELVISALAQSVSAASSRLRLLLNEERTTSITVESLRYLESDAQRALYFA